MADAEHGASEGFCLWFTGLSGSGKSTITTHLVKELRKRGSKLEVLDGDVVRDSRFATRRAR